MPPSHSVGHRVDLTHLVTAVERRLVARLRAVVEPEGYTIDDWRVLDLLSDGAGHTMSELGQHALLLAPTLTKLIDRLVANNLVYRRSDPLDRRRVRAYLTPRGQDLHRKLGRKVHAATAELDTLADATALRRLLAEFLDALEAEPQPV